MDRKVDALACMRDGLRAHVQQLPGSPDPTGLEVAMLVQMTANLYAAVSHVQTRIEGGVSGPRWRLLMRLLDEEYHSLPEGITPSELSRCQNVSKNTISVLLRGLEEQGLIQRALDPLDRRVFRIRLTDAGRRLVETSGPQHVEEQARLLKGMTLEEQNQLIHLFHKLYVSILENSSIPLCAAAPEDAALLGG
jgi:DNA-binding MarR family transcriptional regulator